MSNVKIEVDVVTKAAQANVGLLNKSFIASKLAVIGIMEAIHAFTDALGGVASAIGGTVKSAIDLENGIAEIETLLSDTTQTQKQFTNEILNLQKAFGGSQQDLAKGYYQAISSGAVDATTAQGLLTTANKLAAGGVTDVATAVDGLTNIINGYGLKAEDATKISDSLFIGMKQGKTTVGELSSNIGKVASSAAGMNVSMDETIAVMSTLTTAGLTTSKATTQLRATLTNLAKPSKNLAEAMQKAGIESNAASISSIGYIETLKKLVNTTDGSAESIKKLFGSVEAGDAVIALTGKLTGKYTETLNMMTEATEKVGDVTEEAFDKINKTTGAKLKQAEGNIDAFTTEIGIILKPIFDTLLDAATEVFGDLSKLFDDNKQDIFKWVTSAANDLKRLINDFREFAGRVAQYFNESSDVVQGFKTAMKSLAEGGSVYLTALYDSFRIVREAIELYDKTIGKLIGLFSSVDEASNRTKASLDALWVALNVATLGLPNLIAGVFKAIGHIADALEVLNDFVDDVQDAFGGLADTLIKSFQPAFTVVSDGIKLLGVTFDSAKVFLRQFYVEILTIVDGLFKRLMPAIDSTLAVMGSTIGIFKDDWSEAIDKARQKIKDMSEALGENIKEQQKIVDSSKNVIEGFDGTTEGAKKGGEALYDYTKKQSLLRKKTDEASKGFDTFGKAQDYGMTKISLTNEELREQRYTFQKNSEQAQQSSREITKANDDVAKSTEVTVDKTNKKTEEAAENTEKNAERVKKAVLGVGSIIQSVGEIIEQTANSTTIEIAVGLVTIEGQIEEEIKKKNIEIPASVVVEGNSDDDNPNKPKKEDKEEWKKMWADIGSAFYDTLKDAARMATDILKTGGLELAESLLNAVADIPTALKKGAESLMEAIEGFTGNESGKILEDFPAMIDKDQKELDLLVSFQEARAKKIADLNKLLDEELTKSGGGSADTIRQLTYEIKLLEGFAKPTADTIDQLNDRIKENTNVLEDAEEKYANRFSNVIDEAIKSYGQALIKLVENMPSIVENISKGIPKVMAEVVRLLPFVIKSLMGSIPQVFPVLVKGFTDAFLAIIPLIPLIITKVVEQIPVIIEALGEIIPAVIEQLPAVLAAILEQLPSIIDALTESMPKVITALVDALPALINAILDNLPAIIQSLATLMVVVIEAVIKELPKIIDTIVRAIPKIIQTVVSLIPIIITTIVDALPQIINALIEAIPLIITTVVDNIPAIITAIVDAIPQIITAVIDAIPQIIAAVIRAVPDIVRAFAIQLPIALAQSIGDLFYDAGKKIWDGLMSVFDGSVFSGGGVGGFIGDVGRALDPTSWFANGGIVGGSAVVKGDSKLNDVIPAMLSAGEMVIPRSAMMGGLAGIMAFASNQLGTKPQGYAAGGVVGINTNNVASSVDNSVAEELRQLRQDLNSIGFAIAKNTGDTSKKLKTWDVGGLPQERTA